MFIGIDIGGTSCRVAGTLSLENITNLKKKEFKLTHNFEEDFSTLLEIIQKLSQGTCTAIGMGIPGDLNEDKTTFIDPAKNLHEWGDIPVKDLLEKEFSCPVFLENDAVAAALGEAVYGKTYGNFAFIIWGTGIGGALVSKANGKYRSDKLPWKTYFANWEEQCGGNKIKEYYGYDAVHLSKEQWEQVVQHFASHISFFVDKTHVQTIIFGGGIATKQSERLLKLREQFPSVNIAVSTLGEDCGLYGAFALIRNSSSTSLEE